jgi:hypothetical protein
MLQSAKSARCHAAVFDIFAITVYRPVSPPDGKTISLPFLQRAPLALHELP